MKALFIFVRLRYVSHQLAIAVSLGSDRTPCGFSLIRFDGIGSLESSRQDPSSQFRLAIGSYVEQYSNAVTIVKKNPSSEDFGSLYKAAEFDHPYPCTKIMWSQINIISL